MISLPVSVSVPVPVSHCFSPPVTGKAPAFIVFVSTACTDRRIDCWKTPFTYVPAVATAQITAHLLTRLSDEQHFDC